MDFKVWEMAPVNYVDNIHMIFPSYMNFKYQFYHTMKKKSKNAKAVAKFLKAFNKKTFILSIERAVGKISSVEYNDWLFCFGTNDQELALNFKKLFCREPTMEEESEIIKERQKLNLDTELRKAESPSQGYRILWEAISVLENQRNNQSIFIKSQEDYVSELASYVAKIVNKTKEQKEQKEKMAIEIREKLSTINLLSPKEIELIVKSREDSY